MHFFIKFLSRFTYSFNSIYWGLISWSLFWSPVIKKWTRTTFLVCGAYILESTERQRETRKNKNTGTVSVGRWAEEDKRQHGGGMGRRAEIHNSSGLLWTSESLSSDGDSGREAQRQQVGESHRELWKSILAGGKTTGSTKASWPWCAYHARGTDNKVASVSMGWCKGLEKLWSKAKRQISESPAGSEGGLHTQLWGGWERHGLVWS